jgi:hypothetical protein
MYTKVTYQPFHGERDIILAVRDFVKMNGIASFKSIREWLPTALEMVEGDHVYLENTRMKRINKIIQNLQNHQTLEMLQDCDIVSVKAHGTEWDSGFATRQYAKRHKIPILRISVTSPPTVANSARRRSELDAAISKELYDLHKELGEPSYAVDPITLRMEVLRVFEEDPVLSLNIVRDVAEEVLLRHIL